jgi:hypothetical protein
VEIAFNVGGEFGSSAVAAVALTFESFHGDPIKITTEKSSESSGLETAKVSALNGFFEVGTDFRARAGRVLFAKHAEELIEGLSFQMLSVGWQ